MSGYILVG